MTKRIYNSKEEKDENRTINKEKTEGIIPSYFPFCSLL
jgi:hypothetical protein